MFYCSQHCKGRNRVEENQKTRTVGMMMRGGGGGLSVSHCDDGLYFELMELCFCWREGGQAPEKRDNQRT